MALSEAQQKRIRLCVDNLTGAGANMEKDMMFGFCTNLEKAGRLDSSGHWARKEYAEVFGLPVFKAGKHNGEEYSDSDLDEMAESYGATQELFKRPVRLTHRDQKNDVGSAAMGTIARAYTGMVNGVKHLMVDLERVPDKLAEAVAQGRILDRSIELYSAMEHGGKKYRNVLRALAFLGDEIPGVKGLPPLEQYVYSDGGETVNLEFKAAPEGDGSVIVFHAAPQGDSKTQTEKGGDMEVFKFTEKDGSVREFKTEQDLRDYLDKHTVPRSFYEAQAEAIKQYKEEAEAKERESELKRIDAAFAELQKPIKGRAIPPVVVKTLHDVAKRLPIGDAVIRFSEEKDAAPIQDIIVDAMKKIAEYGLVEMNEKAGAGTANAGKREMLEREAKKNFAERIGVAEGISEEAYVASYVSLRMTEDK